MKLKSVFSKLTDWEKWNYLLKYLPISPVWFWYALRSRSLWWFTPSNPTLTFGGFEGEKKREMYAQLPPGSFPRTVFINPVQPFATIKELIKEKQFTFPLAVKPDAGMMGFMFRKIETAEQLESYHNEIRVDYLLQEFIAYPLEVSIFYYRYPGQQSGHISGFLKKEYMKVIGNGRDTLNELIDNYPRADLKIDEIKSKNKSRLNEIIPYNESVILSQALNLSRGGKLVSLKKHIDKDLLEVFDAISNYSKTFFYGRYDIKCASIADLKKGKNYSILEFNGSGAEPHHIYGNGHSVFQAYAIVLQHWKVLFEISRINNQKGVEYWKFKKGWQFLSYAKRHFKRLKILDASYRY